MMIVMKIAVSILRIPDMDDKDENTLVNKISSVRITPARYVNRKTKTIHNMDPTIFNWIRADL
jgi:hypothetical protein